MTTVIAPAIIVLLAVPMILEKVPRNRWYGFRTPYTMSSDEVWYRANRMSGMALLGAGALWILLGLVLPNVITSPVAAYRYVLWTGVGSVSLAVAVSFWLVYRR